MGPDRSDDARHNGSQSRLDRQISVQALVHDILADLLQSDSAVLDTAITKALGQLGDFTRCDRAYVFRIREDGRMDNTHEWCGPDIAPMIRELQDLPLDLASAWLEELRAGHTVWLPDVDALPDARADKPLLQMQGIQSLLVVPMLTSGMLKGFAGYDAVRRARAFGEGEQLALRSVSAAIHARLDARDAIRRSDQALTALAEERSRLTATLEAIPDLVVELAPDGTIGAQHSGAHEGVARLQGKPLESALPAKALRPVQEKLVTLAREGGVAQIELPLDLGDGKRWFQARGRRRLDAGGRLAGFVVALRDITETRMRIAEIERLSEIARRTTNLVIVTDEQLRLLWGNPAFETCTGWSLEEARGRYPAEVLLGPKSDRSEVARISAALRTGKSARAHVQCTNRAGVAYWLDFDIQPVERPDGTLRGYMAVASVITALKEAEAKALAERAEAMEASRDGIALTGADGQYRYANRAYCEMLGIDPAGDARAWHWRDLHEAEDAARLDRALARNSDGWTGEVRGVRADTGAQVAQEVTLGRQPDGGLMWIARDISARQAAEAERARLTEDLADAQRRAVIGLVAAGIVHDMNNLLITIGGSAALARDDLAADHPATRNLDRIEQATEQAGAVLKRLMQLGKRPLVTAPTDLRVPLMLAADLARSGLPAQVRLRTTLPDGSASAISETRAVVQVVLNLLINARDALLPKGGEIVLSLSRVPAVGTPVVISTVAVAGPLWRVAVSDTGPGMSPQTADRAFEPYFSTKGERGSGLGLAVVRSLVADTGGALGLYTAEGYGTRFEVFWPVAPDPPVLQAPDAQDLR